jgi:hypothetical protein
MAEHTKGKLDVLFDKSTNRILLVSEDGIIVGEMRFSSNVGMANAKRIVKCWNNFDDLMAVCMAVDDLNPIANALLTEGREGSAMTIKNVISKAGEAYKRANKN